MSEGKSISKEELYKIVLETRNLEISLFWQRSHYFLALNTAVAVGYFSLQDPFYAIPLSLFGLIVSILWFMVNLGGKFWQSRWEHRLRLAEQDLSLETRFFSADWNTIYRDAEQSLKFANHSGIRRYLDHLVLKKPSVSLMMTLLSLVFATLWLFLLALAIFR